MIIRTACPEDLPGMLKLHRVFRSFDPGFDAAAAGPAWRAMLDTQGLTVVVADVAGVVAASCTLAVIPTLSWRGSPFAVIENVGTLAEHRRKGLGQGVLAFAIQRARDAGCYKVTLSTGSQQEGTLRFYEAAGFRRNAKTFFELNLEPARAAALPGLGWGQG